MTEPGENMFITDNTIAEINKLLLKYGLTPNQAKVFLFLSKIGVKTASEISKSLNIPRTETYRLLDNLQEKGILFTIFGKPTKFKVVEIKQGIKILVDSEKNRVRELEKGTENIIKLWNSVTKYADLNEKLEANKFQTLQGRNSILVKLQQMVKESSESIIVLGTELDFKKFYHTEFVELLQNTKSELKVLSDYDGRAQHIFEDISSKAIKQLEDVNRENFCFIIKDDNEVIFFIGNPQVKEKLAIWTDSKAFVITLRSLFNLLWTKSKFIEEADLELNEDNKISFDHRLREIEQEKIILSYLQTVFKLTEGEMTSKK